MKAHAGFVGGAMNILVTAGNTQAPIDRVRCITNIFTGRTGTQIALAAQARGHGVTLLTSHPEVVSALNGAPPSNCWSVFAYRTFHELRELMADKLSHGAFDALIHSAAISDYLAEGIYSPAPNTQFHTETGRWDTGGGWPEMVDRSAGKVKSDEPELWLRMVRAPKLVDSVRADWGFRGVLVKFKLQVGIADDELLRIAEASRQQSNADLMVANTLEGASTYAFLGPVSGGYERVSRRQLSGRLLTEVERYHKERSDG
jgi:phosphopantothenoylcysteine synthetase/decarboxylase